MNQRCYIFDIDGTLANGGHRLHHITKKPKDWTSFFANVHADEPIPHIVRLCRDLMRVSTAIFVSGRSDECRDATIKWLWDHVGVIIDSGWTPQRLYMRKAGDYRDDSIIKIEMLEQVRADGWEPIMVFDDRNRVVKAWRDAGVPCAHVAEGDF